VPNSSHILVCFYVHFHHVLALTMTTAFRLNCFVNLSLPTPIPVPLATSQLIYSESSRTPSRFSTLLDRKLTMAYVAGRIAESSRQIFSSYGARTIQTNSSSGVVSWVAPIRMKTVWVISKRTSSFGNWKIPCSTRLACEA